MPNSAASGISRPGEVVISVDAQVGENTASAAGAFGESQPVVQLLCPVRTFVGNCLDQCSKPQHEKALIGPDGEVAMC